MIKVAAAALFLAMQMSSAHAQTLSGGDMGPDISLWRVAAALILCMALAAGAIFALRRRLGVGASPFALFASGQRRMLLIEAIRPHPSVAICLIRCDNQDYLIAVGAQGGSLIERIEAPRQTDGTP